MDLGSHASVSTTGRHMPRGSWLPPVVAPNGELHHVFVPPYPTAATALGSDFTYMRIEPYLDYTPFAEDFGPVSLASVFEFCRDLRKLIEENPTRLVAVVTKSDVKSLTNSIFLLGSYLIVILNRCVESVENCFKHLGSRVASFRDISPGRQNFDLFLSDCWSGLRKASALAWVGDRFDLEQYLDLGSTLNADMHEVIPGKMFAMRGPKNIGKEYKDVVVNGTFSHREFSAVHYASILQELNVQVVVRLNGPVYDAQDFVDAGKFFASMSLFRGGSENLIDVYDLDSSAGIAVVDLFYEDCTTPPVDVAAKFLDIVEGIPGRIVVHCKAGLGRTGTLIALYMMKHYGFTAREAMAWLRIVRAGSVIGVQQQFLCAHQSAMRRAGEAFRRPRASPPARPLSCDVGCVMSFIDEVCMLRDLHIAATLPPSLSVAEISSVLSPHIIKMATRNPDVVGVNDTTQTTESIPDPKASTDLPDRHDTAASLTQLHASSPL